MSAHAIPQGDLGERIQAAVRDAKKPVSFKGLAKLVKAEDEPLRAALELAVGGSHVYRWPDYRRSQYFWHTSPEEKAREAVLAAVAVRALSKPDLGKAAAKSLPGFPSKRLETVITSLVAENQLQAAPALASSAKLFMRTGDGEAYFHAARAFVEGKIRAAGFDPAGFLKEASLQDNTAPRVAATALLLEAVRSLEPVRGVPVSTLRLRNHLPQLAKHEFDLAALELRRKQEVFLSLHADPYNLSLEDKNLLIDGQDGTYYVALALR
jgi:hypothetical protein